MSCTNFNNKNVVWNDYWLLCESDHILYNCKPLSRSQKVCFDVLQFHKGSNYWKRFTQSLRYFKSLCQIVQHQFVVNYDITNNYSFISEMWKIRPSIQNILSNSNPSAKHLLTTQKSSLRNCQLTELDLKWFLKIPLKRCLDEPPKHHISKNIVNDIINEALNVTQHKFNQYSDEKDNFINQRNIQYDAILLAALAIHSTKNIRNHKRWLSSYIIIKYSASYRHVFIVI